MFNKYSTFQLWRTFLLRDAALNEFSWLSINIDILEIFNKGFLDDFFDKNQNKRNEQKQEMLKQLIDWSEWGEVDLNKTDDSKISLTENKFNIEDFKSISLNFFFQNKPVNPNPVDLSFENVYFITKNNEYIFIKNKKDMFSTASRFDFNCTTSSSSRGLTIHVEFYDKWLVVFARNKQGDSNTDGRVIKIIPIFLFDKTFPFQGRNGNFFHLVNSEPWYLMSSFQKKYPELFNEENIANHYIKNIFWWNKIGFDTTLDTIPVDFFGDLESRLKKQFGEKYQETRQQQINELLDDLELFKDENSPIFDCIRDKNNFLKIFYKYD